MKRVLILGGKGDIGKSIHEIFPVDFFLSVITDREICDLSSHLSVSRFINTQHNFDIIINAAGQNHICGAADTNIDKIRETMEVNVLGFLQIIQFNIPYWKRTGEGSIVSIGSLYGQSTKEGRLSYTISKHALLGMVKNLALELAPFGVLVNSVSPGFVDTKMTRKNNSILALENLQKEIPLSRLATCQDVAKVVYFLCTENNYITGQDIVVDGGYSI